MKVVPPSTPTGHTVFCDDIRYEVSGKITLVGVYAGEMGFVGEFPVTLPKLCLRIIYTEKPNESDEPVEVRVYLPGDPNEAPTYKLELPRQQIQRAPIPAE